ncbi:hypothetical protein M422DRAFT_273914 [Sphaerobolus stellatus SS14]|uniref:Unplaced genomic scaffold SPHSTscaffold_356, whole genome shotgun sequence n=1 Tax=Sphaerobolus stellatus (strain SS14) TaxID=990650 RepID=A0A0C9U7R7_SPHS4|nr:hypothetical protein M422DRAFT_273914 [Sphaerobolus stellatus SS14]
MLQDVRKDLGKLLRSLTPEAFDEQWEHIQVEWADQKAWLKYMAKEYIPTKERWAQAWRQHAHEGIDTNNYIESWHSNLKRNYLGRIRRQRVDFLIRLLSEEIEPDYNRAHIRTGIGFGTRYLNKAEQEGKKSAETLIFSEAEARVRVVSAELAMVDSFTKDDIDYEVKIRDNSFVACSCPAFSRSGLICKHMFLAQRVTTYNIQLEKSILPAAVVSDPETIVNEGRRDEKLHLVDKALTLMDLLADRSLFKRVQSSEDELDKVSTASLTQYISAAEGLLHMKNDVFLHKLDHAKQTR